MTKTILDVGEKIEKGHLEAFLVIDIGSNNGERVQFIDIQPKVDHILMKFSVTLRLYDE